MYRLTGGLAGHSRLLNYTQTSGPLPPNYTGGDIDPYLTDLAVADAEADQDFIAPTIFPKVPVPTVSGRFKVWDRGSLLRPEFREHAYGDIPVVGGWKTGQASYHCEHRSLQKYITPSDRGNSKDPMQPEREAALYLTAQVKMDLDILWSKNYFTAGSGWTFQYQGVPANANQAAGTPEFLQFDQTGVNPARLIRGRLERMRLAAGRKPNVLVLGADVYAALVFNPDITDRVKYVQEGIADLGLLARFMDVKTVVVAGSVYNAAPEGLANDFQYIVSPKDMLLVYAAERPSKELPSGGYTFVWENLYQAFEDSSGENERVVNELALIRRGYNGESGVRWVQAHHACGMEIVAPDLGMYFKDVVATSAANW